MALPPGRKGGIRDLYLVSPHGTAVPRSARGSFPLSLLFFGLSSQSPVQGITSLELSQLTISDLLKNPMAPMPKTRKGLIVPPSITNLDPHLAPKWTRTAYLASQLSTLPVLKPQRQEPFFKFRDVHPS